eukprot:TRINITY_DN8900_c0_g1_i5.p1 TRINITY_DN8900_c0_g1~~TRINITY_DN8900_c0_g1_i5.p1  ORF type:complete len:126 (+),score=7.49 TRINITY_DN8900_c0_g1_i5:38-415(+)
MLLWYLRNRLKLRSLCSTYFPWQRQRSAVEAKRVRPRWLLNSNSSSQRFLEYLSVLLLSVGVGPFHSPPDRDVTDPTYQAAVDKLGERGVFEVVALTGFYSTLSRIVNTFTVPVPAGETPPLSRL